MRLIDGSGAVDGYATPFESFTARLVSSTGDVRATGHALADPVLGQWGVAFTNADGDFIDPRPGDRVVVTGAGSASLVYPASSLNANVATDVASGHCLPDAPYELRVDDTYLPGRTDAQGTFSRDVSSVHDVAAGDFLFLTCRYPTGDEFTAKDIPH